MGFILIISISGAGDSLERQSGDAYKSIRVGSLDTLGWTPAGLL